MANLCVCVIIGAVILPLVSDLTSKQPFCVPIPVELVDSPILAIFLSTSSANVEVP